MSPTRKEPVAPANSERSSPKPSTSPGKRPSSPGRKARVILLGLWRAAHDFNVAYKMVVSGFYAELGRAGHRALRLPDIWFQIQQYRQ